VYSNDVLKPELDAFAHVAQWLQDMSAYSKPTPQLMDGAAAVEIARSTPVTTPAQMGVVIDADLQAGDTVEVLPIDYGFQPTQGELLVASQDSIVIKRHDERAEALLVHFPRLGFQVRTANPET
jgi:hypothetical protein